MTLTQIHDYWKEKRPGLEAFWGGRQIWGICLFSDKSEWCSLHFEGGDFIFVRKNDDSLLVVSQQSQ